VRKRGEFNTIKNDPKSWGGDSGKFGGGGGWMTGSYDPDLNLVFWGTANPAPDYDWGEARPGDNLYTSSVLALDPDTGQLKCTTRRSRTTTGTMTPASARASSRTRRQDAARSPERRAASCSCTTVTNGKIQNVWPMNHVYNWV